MTYYLAIDQGTHASRACLFDETGKLVFKHTRTIKLNRINNRKIEQDANEIVDSVRDAVAEVLNETGAQHAISACGIAIQRSSVLAWKDDGNAVSPVLSWQDTRGSQQLAGLRKHEHEIQKLSGLPLSAHYGASKLHYLREQTKDRGNATDALRLSPLISYLLFHLLAEQPYIVDHTNAQRTQLFDINDMAWSSRLADLFKVPVQSLPDVVPVLNHTASAHGKLAGTGIPVTAICGDQNAAFFGAGLLNPETALVNFGSGAFIMRMLPRFSTSDRQLSSIACSDKDAVQFIREATINGAANALTWLENKHKVNNIWQRLPAWLDEVSQPPVFINAIGGFGSPWWNNDIEATFTAADGANYEGETDIAAQAVAVIESIVFMVCANLQIMQSEQPVARLRICGGLSQLDGLCQRLAALSGLPVERMHLPEATARGVAWLAAGDPSACANISLKIFEPKQSPALTERYATFNSTLNALLQV